jgi:3-deoxy-D-manno-octulosonic-acid transferase
VLLIYQLFLFLYQSVIQIAARFNPKAALWINGRKGQFARIKAAMPTPERRIWMHCASLGEFEQGRPVLEAFRKEYPDYKIVLTFFSPSGYEVRKNYDGADYIFYLPMDGRRAARQFLDIVKPELVLFVKYEFWYYYLTEIKRRGIPALLISAAFRKEQSFFKWYGGFFRQILRSFSDILVQDAGSQALLAGIGITEQVQVAGDTRFDRVAAIAAQARVLPLVESFKNNHHLVIAGSTWPADEQALKAALPSLPADWKLIIAPHEIDVTHIRQVQDLFGEEAVLYSQSENAATTARVLIIDNIGMLSSLYRYGDIAFVGGGFNKSGIHNVLEPAVFGAPVLIGPVYKKFVEAVQLVDNGYAFVATDITNFRDQLMNLVNTTSYRMEVREHLLLFMKQHTGATAVIMAIIKKRMTYP